MITVHHLNNSRSQRILWMLEELELDYEIKFYERDAETQLAPQTLKDVHPLGKSPVITDGDQVIAESGAIIEYLGRTYGQNTLTPKPDSPDYQQYIYWLHFAEGSLMPQLLLRLIFEKVKSAPVPFFIKPVTKGIANKVMSAYVSPNIKNNIQFIEQHLSENEWFAGQQLSGADIQMSFPLEASVARGVIDTQHPNIVKYVKRIQARSAYKKALKKGGKYDYSM
ncbi:glutathione S-transferase [Marinicella sp. W31]|uniref:glutathione S-transferase n=1 Tax=Marinicella sp. W31 TaxID=3023713 RepID=UPI0037576FA1